MQTRRVGSIAGFVFLLGKALLSGAMLRPRDTAAYFVIDEVIEDRLSTRLKDPASDEET